ncbi:MAG: chemotaxis protein CheW [Magnetococcus sp. DMHC-1]|nr:purine-binding chemotaxis protein CheW [Magnetococcales bacterium]
MPDNTYQTLVFSLEEQLYGLPLQPVERVLRAVEVTGLPDAPEHILGLINDRGRQLPVLDMRRRLSLPTCPVLPEHRIIVVGGKFPFCFFVDAVTGVIHFQRNAFRTPNEIYPGMERFLSGIFTWNDATVLVFDCNMLFAGLQMGTIWPELQNTPAQMNPCQP